MNPSPNDLTERTIVDVHTDREISLTSEKDPTSPVKMKLPQVSFQWSNVWYYLKGEPYIPGVETRLSLEPNHNRDYLQLQREAKLIGLFKLMPKIGETIIAVHS